MQPVRFCTRLDLESAQLPVPVDSGAQRFDRRVQNSRQADERPQLGLAASTL